MGSISIDISLKNIWKSWFAYRRGKKLSRELLKFQYHLEENLLHLSTDLQNRTYRHGNYKTFIVSDNKRREISVATVRDRIVHRLLYDYLCAVYDKTFVYDVWSCRRGKGLTAAIRRVQLFFFRHRESFIWRSDIQKFFDSVDHEILLKILSRRVHDTRTFSLLQQVIRSFSKNEYGKGMPIGNLTSQIFANIYLNEFDRFVKYRLKPKTYLRYGDDFILIHHDYKKIADFRNQGISYLKDNLKLSVNEKNDCVRKMRQGLKFLGIILYPKGHRLNHRNRMRIDHRLHFNNAGSYYGIVRQHENHKKLKAFHWKLFEKSSAI